MAVILRLLYLTAERHRLSSADKAGIIFYRNIHEVIALPTHQPRDPTQHVKPRRTALYARSKNTITNKNRKQKTEPKPHPSRQTSHHNDLQWIRRVIIIKSVEFEYIPIGKEQLSLLQNTYPNQTKRHRIDQIRLHEDTETSEENKCLALYERGQQYLQAVLAEIKKFRKGCRTSH